MTRGEELYHRWAPADSVWAPWQKPVLFTQIRDAAPAGTSAAPGGPATAGPSQQPIEVPESALRTSVDTGWAPPATQKTAVVVDLPGDEPLRAGVALAAKGYQPVVLYNCCDGPSPVLDLRAVMRALAEGAAALEKVARPRADAPPAFLIDARRATGDRKPMPGLFDNRWVVLPQDFPSGTFLKANGVERVLLVHDRDDAAPRDDLAHVLLRWQEAGVAISATRPGGTPAEVRVSRPSRFRAAWYSALVIAGLRPNSAGGFGSLVPVPSPGGG